MAVILLLEVITLSAQLLWLTMTAIYCNMIDTSETFHFSYFISPVAMVTVGHYFTPIQHFSIKDVVPIFSQQTFS